jgi:phage tail sheath protein FI
MPISNYRYPGIYVEEVPAGPNPIQPVGTSTAGFLGEAPDPKAHVNEAVAINNWAHFVREFVPEGATSTPLSHGVYGFFNNGGARCYVVNVEKGKGIAGGGRKRRGVDVLSTVDEVAIVAAPGYSDPASHVALVGHCENLKDRVAILDPPEEVDDITLFESAETAPTARGGSGGADSGSGGGEPSTPGLHPQQSKDGFGTIYFPWITVTDPLGSGETVNVPPSGHMAGIWARTDATRGVHKAPANEPIRGALNLTYRLTRDEQGSLNEVGVNCLRLFTREGILVWGARTIADPSSEWRYLNVRRLFNMMEESIGDGTNWVVFEPNDRTLWKNIKRDVGAFLLMLWRDGALMGRTPDEAFFVKCDEETNPPESIDQGLVITMIGAAPVKPAEFIVFRISQSASGAQVQA